MCYACIPKVVHNLNTGEHPCPGPINNALPSVLPPDFGMTMASHVIDNEFAIVLPRTDSPMQPTSSGSFGWSLNILISAPAVEDMAIRHMYQSLRTHLSIARRVEFSMTILEGLRWRFTMQRQFLFVLQNLVQHCLITPLSVMQEIDFGFAETDPKILVIKERLEVFEFVREMGNTSLTHVDPKDVLKRNFKLPVLWLAVLIARSDSDIEHVTQNLIHYGHFGNPDIQLLNVMASNPGQYDFKYNEIATDRSDRHSSDSMVGFWLPHGQNFQIWAHSTRMRYTEMIQAYGVWWGDGIWGNESALVEMLTMIEQHGTCHEFQLALF